ncbi:MAG: 2Fe-2S iron-sulfur cluster-binding protein [Verrucomicrobia bacterium]|nr:2Fe-2S iron-sulfur cluster-binding protein [Verrucomicrobiota bacterium]MDA1085970.1 2Fe-2S iron-sulfur cluster-binding protein [Verrucomicrobiota bacterium]
MSESITLQIDDHTVTVSAGATVLDAARQVGVEIPTLCFFAGRDKSRPSCMACLVRVNGATGFMPSCATPAEEGMTVESECADVRDARRSAMELLFSDHLGDCIPVCQRICPAHLQIPAVIRLVAAGELEKAIKLVKDSVALPGVVGHICRAACENGCRRGKFDGSVSIRMIEREVAQVDIAADRRYVPACGSSTGKRVAIVGSGPAGLATAFYLLRAGHACVVYDEQSEPGGSLRYAVPAADLPRSVLDGDIEIITRMGMEYKANARLGRDLELGDLIETYDAVVLAIGNLADTDTESLEVKHSARAIRVDAKSFATQTAGVFAVGAAVHAQRDVARSVGDGKSTADAVERYLQNAEPPSGGRPFTSTIPHLAEEEYRTFVTGANSEFVDSDLVGEAAEAAGRCCHCDCRAADNCKLRLYAEQYDVDPKRFQGESRRSFQLARHHAGVVFEPGKCISCGICVDITEDGKEPLGLTFIGRGFDVEIGVPFDRTIAEGLQKVADAVVGHCPTGALSFDDDS